MKTFKIKDNNRDIPMIQTDYYKWLLEKNPKDIHSINTKIEYLESFRFIKNYHKLSEDDLNSLKYIEDAYFRFEMKQYLILKKLFVEVYIKDGFIYFTDVEKIYFDMNRKIRNENINPIEYKISENLYKDILKKVNIASNYVDKKQTIIYFAEILT